MYQWLERYDLVLTYGVDIQHIERKVVRLNSLDEIRLYI